VDVASIDTLVHSPPTITKKTLDWEVRGVCSFASLGNVGNPMQPNAFLHAFGYDHNLTM
jgi:hypothetical protein